jgi:hypothetical protein
MKGMSGRLNTSSVIEFIVASDPTLIMTEHPIKKGSTWKEFGHFSRINEININHAIIKFDDLVNSISIRVQENKSFVKSKIYVKLPNPSMYNVSEFFLEGHFKYIEVKSHTDGKVVKGDNVLHFLEQDKIVTFANRIFIKKIGDALVSSASVETEFGKLVRRRKHIEVDI